MRKFIDLTGQIFNGVQVVSRADDKTSSAGRTFTAWSCVCKCGKPFTTITNSLMSGKTKSCGCSRIGNPGTTKHGQSGGGRRGVRSKEYRAWAHMNERCNNPNHKNFAHYGGRGISVCDRWKEFSLFLSDMGSAPTPQHTLDRIDNDKNYSPDNCRWATQTEQVRNRRNTKLVTCDGVTLPVQEWSEKVGVRVGLIKDRLRLGWAPEDAVFTPVGVLKRYHWKTLLKDASSPS